MPNSSADQKSQSDLATQMGISVDTLQNYKQLAEMIPELDELVDTGIVTKTTVLAIMRNLSLQHIIIIVKLYHNKWRWYYDYKSIYSIKK